MKLIQDLGTRPANRNRHGIYECPDCGKHFECRTASVTSGRSTRCKDCGRLISALAMNKLQKIRAASSFVAKALLIHSNLYSYGNVVYDGAYSKIIITCKVHGEFTQRPNDHLNGCGCPKCAITGFKKTKSATLYYLRITSGTDIAYKVGITNRTVQERFNNIDLEKIQVLKIWEFPLGVDAYDKEQEILKLYKEHKYIGEPLLSSGNTELFTHDILSLDYLETPEFRLGLHHS